MNRNGGAENMMAEHPLLGPIAPLKPAIRLAVIAAISETALLATLLSGSQLIQGQPYDTHFIVFILAVALYAITAREFKKRLHILFEERIATIRRQVMERVRTTDLYSFEQIGAEYLYTALTFDVKAVSDLSHTVAATAYAGFLLFGVLLYLAILSEYTLLLVLGIGGLVGFFYGYNQSLIRQITQQVREQETQMIETVRHLLDGFKELRLNDKKSDDFFYNSLKQHLSQVRQLRLQRSRYFLNSYSLTYGLWKVLIIIPVLIIPLVGAFSHNILTTFLGIILFIPTNYLVEEVPRIILAGISMQRLYRLEQTLDTMTPESPPPEGPAEPVEFEELSYRNIRFHYEDSDGRAFTLGPLDFALRAGEIVFITGGNGSGKTTFLKVLTGLYYPDGGQILLNRQEGHIQQLRSLFSPVFNDFHLFDRLYGSAEIDTARINELLAIMRLESKVQFTENQFNTLQLSTGQRKRLALICAMMEQKPIYVFDEWAAEQDPHFRKYFYLTLLPQFKAQGKTVLAITHDDQYFHAADRVVKMEYGRFVDA
jgi:putative ATP-binding cassette transporter